MSNVIRSIASGLWPAILVLLGAAVGLIAPAVAQEADEAEVSIQEKVTVTGSRVMMSWTMAGCFAPVFPRVSRRRSWRWERSPTILPVMSSTGT